MFGTVYHRYSLSMEVCSEVKRSPERYFSIT
ncbi:hypothetical protein FP2506_10956 [Fulvimarina pelagi HTCC2506]|uniref:Uncharacterized protein n=1 Tax=Fulvimarina pelagi HTCC2506 TaxID=314231 RepID=Q0G4Q5_9HYPH|nr:hypothetical protein FP2506_10956 [Fulvimarina pelagi HTCC2506]